MNVTIFPTGKGGAKSAVDYLLSDKDHAGKKRSVMPEILFGDPNTFTQIANATSREHKYTSGVIAFHDNESITEGQVHSLIETFRSTFMAGLKVDENFADFWVAHRDKGNLELHFLVANTELTTGNQLNIHPPGEKNIQFFNTFVSVMNDSFGFAQVVPDPLKIALKPFEAKSPNGTQDKKAKNVLAKTLHSHILDGTVANRDELIAYIGENIGEVTRVGQDYISVMLPGSHKPKRLRGELFKQGGDYQKLIAQHHASKVPKFLAPTEAQSQKEKLLFSIQTRAVFNQRRYLTSKPGAKRSRAKVPTAAPSDMADRIKQVREAVSSKDIAATLHKQLGELKDEAAPVPQAVAPRGTYRSPEPERADINTIVMGEFAVTGLESQIGALSMQYQCLMLLMASARGRRAANIKSQIILLEQQLSALNLELQNKKVQLADDQKLKFK